MEKEKIKALIKKYQSGQCSGEERALLESWYDDQLKQTASTVSEQQLKQDLATIYNRLPGRVRKPSTPWISIAASLFILFSLSAGLYFYSQTRPQAESGIVKVHAHKDLGAGLGKIFLTLADGRTISITDAAIGKIASERGIQINKLNDNLISYTVVPGEESRSEFRSLNVLTTSRGSQCQVLLPDGTAIWMNAATSLKFPSRFSGKKRRVELDGEAYFEVSKNKSSPFEVLTGLQEVQVLGTHFNVSSYLDEAATKTTLLEGKVKVIERQRRNDIILLPGEQSTLNGDAKLQVAKVDVDNVVAWRSGLFQFQNSDLGHVTRQLARWYNVKFEFSGKIPATKLWGEFHRNERLEKALELFEFFDLDYNIVNKGGIKTVIITEKNRSM
jgi:ferric-dicitrate binding protein FerR (iron transport regulator)